ncbi:MAG: SPFH/Band 7/PHB domain protein [Candidatus Freyarchaeota archaeon]|nr:SPFH/Band 7/PHB domain protein [Candidatus Jordarchaeia archaeon]MBS7267991.1 SPFH/Band 7/PHB domain protein [Candidatus Jordarchaeia archaeon]MBS7278352.1 SPFH/Band 7/PHB domain protein [Candidatus Jordarchaeia archaeon]
MDGADYSTLVILMVVIVFILLALIVPNIKILREYERAVIFRLGRVAGTKGPGIVFLLPLIDRAVKVDLRENYFEIRRQMCITGDNSPLDIDVLFYYRVINPEDSVVKIKDFRGAAIGIAQTTLRSVIGDIMLDDVLAKREYINTVLRDKLDEMTERWGVKVTSVEIREILPPSRVQNAMVRQMEAERIRRAMVIEADGTKEAAIKVAEGDARSEILKAEGDREAAILEAEGVKQSVILEAEGEALALDKVFGVVKDIDSKTMTLQYLKALDALGNNEQTRMIFPLDFSSLTGMVSEHVDKASEEAAHSSKKKVK